MFSTIEVLYKLYWDNVMDWGVLNLRTSQGLLRNTLTFPKWVRLTHMPAHSRLKQQPTTSQYLEYLADLILSL